MSTPTDPELEVQGAPPGTQLVVHSLEAATRALQAMGLTPQELDRCQRVASNIFYQGARTLQLIAPRPPADGPDITPYQRELLFELLSDARDNTYRAAEELDASDPVRERLWALAGELDAAKVTLGRRCRSCP